MGKKKVTWKDGVVEDSRTGTGGGSANVITDTRVLTIPDLPGLPAAGGSFLDPTFQTTIRRLTDAGTLAGSLSVFAKYAYWDIPNLDATRLAWVAGNGDGVFMQFDPATGASSNVTSIAGGVLSYEHSCIWSRTNANKLFGFQGAFVKTLTWTGATPGAWTNLVNLAANAQMIAKFGSSGWYVMHLSLSANDDVICGLVKANSNNAVLGCFAYKFSTSTGYAYDNTICPQTLAPTSINEVQVDKSGAYIFVSLDHDTTSNAQPEGLVITLSNSNIEILTDGSPDYNPSHQDSGNNFEVGEDNWRSKITARSLSAPHTHILLGGAGGFTMQQAAHPSLRHDNENWVLMGSYTSNPGTPMNGELWLMKTDGSATFRRLCHHRNVYPNPGGVCPWQTASRDLKWVFFCSNWGIASGRVDGFALRVPDGTAP